jgi:hypothetical protein
MLLHYQQIKLKILREPVLNKKIILNQLYESYLRSY